MAIALLIMAILFGYIMIDSGKDMIKGIWFAPIGVLLYILGIAILVLSSLSLIRLIV